MNARFYSPQPIQSATATLAEAEAHHLLHVLRARRGDEITLFDGSGSEFLARITEHTRREVHLEILAEREVDREARRVVTLAVALPKGDRQRFLVEKCVELGVARLIPLETEWSVAQASRSALERLRRTVVEASKQCGRNRLMAIDEPCRLDDLLTSPAPTGVTAFLAHPGGSVDWSAWSTRTAEAAFVAIGPEGGFSPQEVHLAVDRGWQTLHLGPRILRMETAAVAVAACCLADPLPK